jgi:hypothetical protein
MRRLRSFSEFQARVCRSTSRCHMAGLGPAIHVLSNRKTWMPATSAGMTLKRWRPCSTEHAGIRFTFQTANQTTIKTGVRYRPVSLRRRVRRRLFSRPLKYEGDGAPSGATIVLLCARGPSRNHGAPLGAPPRQACAVWAYLRASSLRHRAALFVGRPFPERPSVSQLLAGGSYWPPSGAPGRPGACFA